jgi:predicted nucleic acid-binding protein
LREWAESGIFVWLVSEEILEEYKQVLGRLGVRRNLIGNIINLLREEAEFLEAPVTFEVSPDPADNPFCACAERGNAAFIVTLNPKDFPQKRLRAKVIPPGALLPTTAPRRARTKR